MAWNPGAIRKEITKHRKALINPRGVCHHVAVSNADSLYSFFLTAEACSHFYIRRSGIVEQYVDTRYQAPAQRDGNSSMISTESEGGVTNANTEQWTAEQVEAHAKLDAWINATHGIPLVPMPDSLPESRGIGYHRLGIDPWRVSGGELWSSSYGKICPGAGKIAQIPEIINRARTIAGASEELFTVGQFEDLMAKLSHHDAEEDNRYVRYETLFGRVMTKLEEVTTSLAETAAAVAARESEAAAAGRYAHVVDTLTKWAEERDNIRQDELLAELSRLHPPVEEPPAPKA